MSNLKALLIKHESMKLKPYLDCCGKFWRDCVCPAKGNLTIGVGRNLDTMGISSQEALLLLDADESRVLGEAGTFNWFNALDQVRQDAFCDMLFNLGLSRFCGFKRLIAAFEKNDMQSAASEMLNSKWAAQVKGRAVELADMLRSGSAQATLEVLK
jgi:lysozyme